MSVGPRSSWWTLGAVCGATFMLLVDVTIVQVALPRIHNELHATFSQLQWVIDAYALTLAALVLTGGSLADHFGRRNVFAAGVAIFTLASLLCGVSQTGVQLDFARGFQGIGGAIMFATSLALIAQDYSGKARGTAIALWSATIGSAVAVGPVLGGALTEGLGWRWVFFVNLPIGVFVLAIVTLRMRNVNDPHALRLDLGGLVTFSAALFMLVLALQRGNDDGWSSALVVGLLAGAAVMFVVFVLVEARQERPMFDLALFRNRAFSGVSIGTFAIGGGMFAAFPYLTLYLQNLLGLSPLQGGLRLLPSTVFVFLVPLLVRRLGPRLPAGIALGIGLALIAVGLLLMSRLHSSSDWTALLPGLVVAGIGIGLANPSIAYIALAVVPPNRSGMASGISNTFRIGGLACGVAGLGAVLQHAVAVRLPAGAHGLAGAVVSGGPKAAAARLPPAAQQQFAATAHDAFVAGTIRFLLVGAVIAAAGSVATFLLVRSRDLVPAQVPAPAAAGQSG